MSLFYGFTKMGCGFLRLTCTNCDAQYEVPDDAVPAAGREVQCSNCGHTWFAQPKPLGAAIRTNDPVSFEEDDDEIDFTPPPQPRQRPQQENGGEAYKQVLREEAERELAARQADADPELEIQPDLGIETVAAVAPRRQDIRNASRAPEPVADPDPEPPAPREKSASRAQLPDIEEINSSLSAATKSKVQQKSDAPYAKPVDGRIRRKRGFRFGFVLALFVLAAFVALYIFAPQLAQSYPQLANELNNYVLVVNDARQELFKWAKDLTDAIQAAGGTPTDQN